MRAATPPVKISFLAFCEFAPAALTLLCALQLAQAQKGSGAYVCYTSDVTISSAVNKAVIIGYPTETNWRQSLNRSSPNVIINNGASVPQGLVICNQSNVAINGGSVGSVSATDQSVVTVKGGTFSNPWATGKQATIKFYGTQLRMTQQKYTNGQTDYVVRGLLNDKSRIKLIVTDVNSSATVTAYNPSGPVTPTVPKPRPAPHGAPPPKR